MSEHDGAPRHLLVRGSETGAVASTACADSPMPKEPQKAQGADNQSPKCRNSRRHRAVETLRRHCAFFFTDEHAARFGVPDERLMPGAPASRAPMTSKRHQTNNRSRACALTRSA